MKLYIWPDGTVFSDDGNPYWELPQYLSDDFFIVDMEKSSHGEADDLVKKHFGNTDQCQEVLGEVHEYYMDEAEY